MGLGLSAAQICPPLPIVRARLLPLLSDCGRHGQLLATQSVVPLQRAL